MCIYIYICIFYVVTGPISSGECPFTCDCTRPVLPVSLARQKHAI